MQRCVVQCNAVSCDLSSDCNSQVVTLMQRLSLHCTVLHSTLRKSTLLHGTAVYFTVVYCIVIYPTILHYTALVLNILTCLMALSPPLHFTALLSALEMHILTALHCTVVHCPAHCMVQLSPYLKLHTQLHSTAVLFHKDLLSLRINLLCYADSLH